MARTRYFSQWLLAFAASIKISLAVRGESSTRAATRWWLRKPLDYTIAGNFRMPFPKGLADKYSDTKEPEHLGGGWNADAWLVKDKEDLSDRVVKVWVVKALFGFPKQYRYGYATWAVAREEQEAGNPALVHALASASRECEVAVDMHNPQKQAGVSDHVMKCFKSNIKDSETNSSQEDFLYLELEYSGKLNLLTFMEAKKAEGSWQLPLIMGVYRQLLLALSYLSHHESRWVHHDVSLRNVVIKVHNEEGLSRGDEDALTVSLIDFGNAIEGNQGNSCTEVKVEFSFEFAPPEVRERCEPNEDGYRAFIWCEGKPDPAKCAQSYDVYSSTLVFANMLAEATREQLLLPYHDLNDLPKDDNFMDLLARRKTCPLWADALPKGLFARNELEPYSAVLKEAAKGVYTDASLRPSADDILKVIDALDVEAD